jgi:DNA-binding NarL/FixJ family response regulator
LKDLKSLGELNQIFPPSTEKTLTRRSPIAICLVVSRSIAGYFSRVRCPSATLYRARKIRSRRSGCKNASVERVELLAEIKNRNPLTQVLMVTGYPTDYTREESVQLGAAGYLSKPIDMSELKAVLRDLADARKLVK